PALSCAENAPSGIAVCARASVWRARSGSREPITTGTPACPSRRATPKPNAPEAPITATRSVSEVGKAAEYRLHLRLTRTAHRPVAAPRAAVLDYGAGMDPEGKVIVVTGAAGGIGGALVRALAERGARTLVAADLDGVGVEQLSEELGDAAV